MKPLLLLASVSVLGQPAFEGSAALDAALEQAIQDEEIPGAVVLVGHKGRIVHRKAYGFRSLLPDREAMTLDTIFDVASLTKVVATASAVMKLFEQGKIRLNDPVTRYLPDFQRGKSDILVRHLLTHFSGLRPDLDLQPAWSGYETGIRKALIDKPVATPGERFIYSDINFILLGEMVRKLSGKPLAEFVREQVFLPLGMKDTMYNPPASLRSRIAPTEQYPGMPGPLRGVVHDETTRFMGGVAGHAGLFSTADDLARFAEMILGKGTRQDVRIAAPLTVEKFTTPQSPPDQSIQRGLGWDIDSPYSGNRGELFPVGSFGHTGFTGTSLWIDPVSESYVILLTNAVHPKRRPAITSLRGRTATIAAAALGVLVPGVSINGYNETLVGAGARRRVVRNGQTLTGLDVLASAKFQPLAGRKVGLITNHTGISRDGRRNLDLMLAAGVPVRALYSPEHGIAGTEDHEKIGHGRDSASGLPVWSLYQSGNRRPSAEMLQGVDTLVFDIQDVGTRFYTYVCTMLYAMEEAARHKIRFVVLDRPNPITGVHVEGPVLDQELESFIGCHTLPLRHGMTVGELARMLNAERKIGADLHVIAMKGWQRGDWFDATGLPWVNPSPNLRNLTAALLYPAVSMLEFARNYSVGRGTDAPLEQIGAPWIDGPQLARYLNARHIPGVRAYPVVFQPADSNVKGEKCPGVRFVITDRDAYNAGRLGTEIAVAIETLYPNRIAWEKNLPLIGNRRLLQGVAAREDPRALAARQQDDVVSFLARRQPFLLYPER